MRENRFDILFISCQYKVNESVYYKKEVELNVTFFHTTLLILIQLYDNRVIKVCNSFFD